MKTFTIREKATKGLEFFKKEDGPNDLLGVPLGQGIMRLVHPLPVDTVFRLDEVDVVPDEKHYRVVKEARMADKRALVRVETRAGVDGRVTLFANSMNERFCEQRGRVIRETRPIEEAAGVTILAQQEVECGMEFLVALEPGANFRITRTGLLDGAPPELVVVWNGRWDHEMWRRVQIAVNIETEENYPPEKRLTEEELMRPWALKVWPRHQRHNDM